jgi:hypothetical protein
MASCETNLTTQPLAPPFDPVEAGRELWLEERRKGIGSSDASSLFNDGWGCARRLVYDKRNTPVDYQHTPEQLRIFERGNRLEEHVAQEFTSTTGFKTRRQPSREHSDKPYLRTSMDRQIIGVTLRDLLNVYPELEGKISSVSTPGYLECKTANEWTFKKLCSEGPQPDYLMQVQHGLMVTGYEWGVLAVLRVDTFDFVHIPILPDPDFQRTIAARAEVLWQIVTDESAELPARLEFGDKRCASCQWRKTCHGNDAEMLKAGAEFRGVVYDVDDSLAELAADYKTAKFVAEDYAAIAEQIKEKLQAAIGERSAVAVPSAGAKFLFREQAGRRTYDSKALDAELPTMGLADQFTKWLRDNRRDEYTTLVAEWTRTGQKTDYIEKFKKQGKPTRPFRVWFE